jgi:hypothetical protein
MSEWFAVTAAWAISRSFSSAWALKGAAEDRTRTEARRNRSGFMSSSWKSWFV